MSAQQSLQVTRRSFEALRIRRHLVGGKEATKKDLAAQPFIVAGVGLPEEGTAYGFSSEEALCRWAAGTRHAERLARAIGTMKLGQQMEGTETAARDLKRIEAAIERVRGELEELSRKTGLAIGSPEFLDEAAAPGTGFQAPSPIPLLFDKVIDPGSPPADPPVFGGTLVPVIGPIPTFFRFNDKASGVLAVGALTLHDKTFFRGAALFLLGVLSVVLDDVGFNNRAASGIAV